MADTSIEWTDKAWNVLRGVEPDTGSGVAADATINRRPEAHRDVCGRRPHSGVHDEGGDVDEHEQLALAQRVDRCTTLGELEALVREWREVV